MVEGTGEGELGVIVERLIGKKVSDISKVSEVQSVQKVDLKSLLFIVY
jgi:hypothetical protein